MGTILLHECSHVIQERYIPNPIPWFDEGLATYFDGTRFGIGAKKNSTEKEP